jgi:glycine oxidase
MRFVLEEARRAGVEAVFGAEWPQGASKSDIVVDCRGMGARGELADLRGVRGERLVLRTREFGFKRPVRLLHPRHPIYIVPWGDGLFMLGATVIESNDAGPVTVRSALELLGS